MATQAETKLIDALRATGLIQAELARRIGVAQPTVQAWLAGESVPDVATLRKIVADGAFPQFSRLAIAIVMPPDMPQTSPDARETVIEQVI